MLYPNERFVLIRETVKVERQYLVRVDDNSDDPIDEVLNLTGNQEHLVASDTVIEDGEETYIEEELPEDWQLDPTLLKYARFIMGNMGLLEEEAAPVVKKRKRRKLNQGSPQIERESLDKPVKSDIIRETNWSQLAKEME